MVDRRRVLQGIALGTAGLGARSWGLVDVSAAPKVNVWGGEAAGYWAQVTPGRVTRVAAFKGIPYGADTRQTRFQPPAKVAPWTGVKNCTEWAARALQQSSDRASSPSAATRPAAVNRGFNAVMGGDQHYHLPADEGPQSEDCLHLNVWTPAIHLPRRKLPVLFYIHGGAYNNGTVNAELYDGTRLAERGDVVVVTVNHRLNAFGYLYLAGIAGTESRYKDSGNVGMLDLVLALEWVRENIAQFGGDADRVTIFGQSGGGAKCATLMAMEAAKGLFHRVWTMSGQQVWGIPREKATRNAEAALAAMGLHVADTNMNKLNALSMEQIQAGARTTGNWLPVVDGGVLKRDPFQPDAPPISDAIPMVLGNTKDEILGAGAWRQAGLTWQTLPDVLGKELAAFRGPYTTEDIIAAYRKWYPKMRPVDVYVASVAAFRSWPGQVIEAEKRASNPQAAKRTWVYEMDYGVAPADGRAPHTVDIAFVFDNLKLSPGVVGESEADLAAAQPLANLMSGRLVEFAKTGVPGARWPVYDLSSRKTMLFDNVSEIAEDPRGDERRMMAQAGYRQPGT